MIKKIINLFKKKKKVYSEKEIEILYLLKNNEVFTEHKNCYIFDEHGEKYYVIGKYEYTTEGFNSDFKWVTRYYSNFVVTDKKHQVKEIKPDLPFCIKPHDWVKHLSYNYKSEYVNEIERMLSLNERVKNKKIPYSTIYQELHDKFYDKLPLDVIREEKLKKLFGNQ
jgi:hypothetical protein